MKAGQLLTAEGALVLGGLGIAGAGAAVDIWARFAGIALGTAPGEASQGELLGLNTTVTGLAFIAFGLFMSNRPFFMGRGHKRVYLASVLLVSDGLVHLAAIGPHLEDSLRVGFFAVLVAIQIPAGLALPESSGRVRAVWSYLALLLIVLYVASRLASVPYLFAAEEAEGLGVASKTLEVLLIATLLSMRGRTYDVHRPRDASSTATASSARE